MSRDYQVVAKLVNVTGRRSIDEFAFFISASVHKEAYEIAEEKARKIFSEKILLLGKETDDEFEINLVILEKPPEAPRLMVPGTPRMM